MNCTYCEERLSDYLEGALDAAARGLVEEHLKACAACNELLVGVRSVVGWGKDLPAQLPPPWLASRIVSNTPHVIRVTWSDWILGVWKNVCEPRFALGLLTSILMVGWLGSLAGVTLADVALVRHPSAVYNRMGGWANRLYGDAVRSYYSSPLVNAIQCQIHSRIEQFRENS